MSSTTVAPQAQRGFSVWDRKLSRYPERVQRLRQLLLVVAITIALYYALYVGGGVATLMLPQLHMPFSIFVYILAGGGLLGAFA